MRLLFIVVVLGLVYGCANDTAGEGGTAATEPQPATPERREAESVLPALVAEEVGLDRADQQPYQRNQMAKVADMSGYPAAALRLRPAPAPAENRENYFGFEDNGLQLVADNPVSTFAVDVDSASYANVRRLLNNGQLPPTDAVRVEELINYFNYDYPTPRGDVPFAVYTEIGPSPWAADRHLLHVGINATGLDERTTMPPANLTFLIDVSGSMQAPNKLGLLKRALNMLVNQLRPEDHVAIAVYAGAAGEVLAPTGGDQRAAINAALERLQAGGSTNGGAGIQLAYSLARQNFHANGINRVILATDGDFNVGTTDVNALEQLVEDQRKSGVALTVLGFGSGNYNDALMQKIAQIGDGNAAYIDTIHEARKVLVEELGATLEIVAKDVKVQVEFNPEQVASYRLIGYETRHLNREDFNNDRVDAGEIGRGHTVTALYEITLAGSDASLVDPLRYGSSEVRAPGRQDAELGFLKLRYKAPQGGASRLISQPLLKRDVVDQIASTSANFRFSAAVAWFGQILRRSAMVDDSAEAVAALALGARGDDPHGYRGEFIKLTRTVAALSVAGAPAQRVSEPG